MTMDANRTVMSMIDKINDRNILLGKAASEYSRKHGRLDPSFENAMLRFEEQKPPYKPEDYFNAYRLIEAGSPRGALSTPAPVPVPVPSKTKGKTNPFEGFGLRPAQ